MNGKFFRNGIVMLVLVVGTVALLYTFLVSPTSSQSKPYSSYLADVRAGNVTQVTQQDLTLTVTTTGSPGTKYTTVVPGVGLQSAFQDTQDAAKAGGQDPTKIVFTAMPASDAGQWVNLLVGALLPVLLIGGFLFFMMRQAQGTNNQAPQLRQEPGPHVPRQQDGRHVRRRGRASTRRRRSSRRSWSS